MFALLTGITGCSYIPTYEPTGFGSYSPTPPLLRAIPEGNDSFSTGWRDGCNTYLGFVGEGVMRMRPFTFDVNRSLKDPLYAAGYREGASLCTFYTNTRPN